MSYKSILVPLNGNDSDGEALSCAYQLARLSGCHINALHVQADSKEAVPLLGEGMSGSMIEEMIDLADKDADQRSNRARETYEKFVQETGLPDVEEPLDPDHVTDPSISWLMKVGREDEIVSRGGKISDLTVIARPKNDVEQPSMMTLHAAIFETGKPVLIVPPKMPDGIGKRVLIAWNGTSEAAAAVSAALPFLKQADQVVIFTVETEKALSRIKSEELVKNLVWHGIQATIKKVELSTQSVGEMILGECNAMNADLLVTGAYTHSRLIQIILGGVTKHIIAEAEIPVLAAH